MTLARGRRERWRAPLLATGLLSFLALGSASAESARMVRDIRTGAPAEHEPQLGAIVGSAFANVGGRTFFLASDGANGSEVWVTDGTPEETRIVRDVFPGPDRSSYDLLGNLVLANSVPRAFTAWRGDVYFAASTDAHRPVLLFRSDGTAEGTRAIGREPSGVQRTVGADAALFAFTATSLWSTDGTASGTRRLARVSESPAGDDRVGAETTVIGPELFFVGWDEQHGRELWASGGTVETTRLLFDAYPGAGSSSPSGLLAAGGHLYFFATDPSGASLYRFTPGTSRPIRIFDFGGSGGGSRGASLGSSVVFGGTAAGTCGVFLADPRCVRRISDVCGGGFVSSGGTVYFSARDSDLGQELWSTDGTPSGTRFVADLYPGPGDSYPSDFVPFAGGVLFIARLADGEALLFTDGTTSGTELVARGLGRVTPPFVRSGAALFWASEAVFPTPQRPSRLFLTDGTAAGTRPLFTTSAPPSSAPSQLAAFGDRLVFSADDGTTGRDPWESDGTDGGTRQLLDLGWGSDWSNPEGFVESGGRLFFRARDSGSSSGIYRSDGTAAGTESLVSALSSRWSPPAVSLPVAWRGGVAFVLGQGESFEWNRLMVSDGTRSGTGPVSEARVHPSYEGPVAAAGFLLFQGSEPGQPFALCRSDGTPTGTVPLLDLSGRTSPPLRELSGTHDRAFFTRLVGGADGGLQLWTTDGTASGTVPLTSLPAIADDEPPFAPAAFDGAYFFRGFDPEHGWELWHTDGTPEGTRLFADLLPGPESSQPSALAIVGERLLFAASDGVHGKEPWESDGTPAGTRMVDDLSPGPASSSPAGFTLASGRVLFSAHRPDVGRELFALGPAPGQ